VGEDKGRFEELIVFNLLLDLNRLMSVFDLNRPYSN
jgi:hypothetical protein